MLNSIAPSWDELYDVANGQSGHFTTQQAAEAGFSPQLLHKHLQGGNLERPMRGIYRISRFPPAEHEDLVILWLWSDREAVFSHETALHLHELSDALPARIHLTLPTTTPRRKRIPEGVIAHIADVSADHRQWMGPVPLTTPERTVLDVAAAHGDASLVAQAINEGIRAERFTFEQVALAASYVANAQGLGTPIRPDGCEALGDSFYVRRISGTCTTPPPSDWPALAKDIAEEHGAYLRISQYHPSRTMHLEFAWPLGSLPEEREVTSLRKQLAKRFSWA